MVYKSQIKATEKYNKKTYTQILIRVRNGKKGVIEKYAKITNNTINTYINNAIDKQLILDGWMPEGQEPEQGTGTAEKNCLDPSQDAGKMP